MSAGELLKLEGIERVSRSNEEFLKLVRTQAAQMMQQYGQITSDDLRMWANLNDIYPSHQNAWGAVFSGQPFKLVGYVKSKIPSNHARVIGLWELK